LPEWKDVGLGGLLALLVLREVFNFLKSKNNGNGRPTAAEQSIEFWREQVRSIAMEILAHTVNRTLDQQVEIATEIRDLQRDINDGIIRLITLYEAKK
jgi:hypothetical protein